MSAWLALAVAAALIPLVRMLRSEGCSSAPPAPPPPPGTRPLHLTVSGSGANPTPGGPEERIRVLGGQIVVTPPDPGRQETIRVPGGAAFFHDRATTAADFSGATSPYHWRIDGSIEVVSDGPSAPGPATVTGSAQDIPWDANRDRAVNLVVVLVDRAQDRGPGTGPGGVTVHDYRLELSVAG